MPDQPLSIGKVAKELGIPASTIHYYVAEGILPAPRKLNRTRAAYSERHVRLLRLIRRLQTAGMPLAYVKHIVVEIGTDDEQLARWEDARFHRPLEPSPLGGHKDTIDHFEPVDRGAFDAMVGRQDDLVDQLLEAGLLRPKGDRYDANDLYLVRCAELFLEHGLSLDAVRGLTMVLPTLRAAVPLTHLVALRHADELRRRDLAFTDVLVPFANVLGYLYKRVADEVMPGWQEHIYTQPRD